MLKTIIKKQFFELFGSYFVDRKTGKTRSKKTAVIFFALFAVLLGLLGFTFYEVCSVLAEVFINGKTDWFYYALTGILALLLGTFGSVFNTYAGIYHAKDNNLLLSMPIKPSLILAGRLVGVYGLSLLYELVVFVPATICFWQKMTPGVTKIIFPVLLWFILAFFISALTCLLGFIVAVIAKKLKGNLKTLISVLFSFIFIFAYYFGASRFNGMLTNLSSMSDTLAPKIKSAVFPAYAFGMGAAGSPLYMLIFTLFAFACFGVTYFIMSKSFISISTASVSEKKAVAKEANIKQRSQRATLFYRELKRFLSSTTYITNCGFGIVMLPALAVAAFIKKDTVMSLFSGEYDFLSPLLPALFTAAVLAACSMNPISSPSVSLEGKNLWIAKSLPVAADKILEAKADLHFVLNAVPASVAIIFLGVIFASEPVVILLMWVCVVVFIRIQAYIGILLNLKMPNLEWTNEIVPIKQGVSVLISIFGGYLLIALFTGCFYLFTKYMSTEIAFAVMAGILSLACALLERLIKTKGVKMFAQL